MLHRCVDFAHDSLLLGLVRFAVSLSRTGSLRAANVTQRNRVSGGDTQPRRGIRPGATVLRLFLSPHDFVDRGIHIDDAGNMIARPWVKLLDATESYVISTHRREIVLEFDGPEHQTR